MDEEGKEEEAEAGEAFQRSDKQRRRRKRWRREREAREMDGKRRQGGSRHETGEIVSNHCEEEKLERLISESGEEGGRDRGKGSNEGKKGKESEERVKVGDSVGNNSDNFFSLLLQWFFCWLAGYLGVTFPWILLVLLLHNRSSLALFSCHSRPLYPPS